MFKAFNSWVQNVKRHFRCMYVTYFKLLVECFGWKYYWRHVACVCTEYTGESSEIYSAIGDETQQESCTSGSSEGNLLSSTTSNSAWGRGFVLCVSLRALTLWFGWWEEHPSCRKHVPHILSGSYLGQVQEESRFIWETAVKTEVVGGGVGSLSGGLVQLE